MQCTMEPVIKCQSKDRKKHLLFSITCRIVLTNVAENSNKLLVYPISANNYHKNNCTVQVKSNEAYGQVRK